MLLLERFPEKGRYSINFFMACFSAGRKFRVFLGGDFVIFLGGGISCFSGGEILIFWGENYITANNTTL